MSRGPIWYSILFCIIAALIYLLLSLLLLSAHRTFDWVNQSPWHQLPAEFRRKRYTTYLPMTYPSSVPLKLLGDWLGCALEGARGQKVLRADNFSVALTVSTSNSRAEIRQALAYRHVVSCCTFGLYPQFLKENGKAVNWFLWGRPELVSFWYKSKGSDVDLLPKHFLSALTCLLLQ